MWHVMQVTKVRVSVFAVSLLWPHGLQVAEEELQGVERRLRSINQGAQLMQA